MKKTLRIYHLSAIAEEKDDRTNVNRNSIDLKMNEDRSSSTHSASQRRIILQEAKNQIRNCYLV